MVKYRIYELSARSVISFATEHTDGRFSFRLDQAITEKCKRPTALHTQDANALFFQMMSMLIPNYVEPDNAKEILALSDVIFYMDFSGIFDRDPSHEIWRTRQAKAKYLFHPNGITLNFGKKEHSYVAFERSGSMSRAAKLSFIRKDFYNTLSKRIMLDMQVGRCQLSKLYAYNGLMLSSGRRVDHIDLEKPHRVIVIDNENFKAYNVRTVTVEETDHDSNMRNYERVEKRMDIDVTTFDGEGVISKEYAKVLDRAYCGKTVHSSFQIRMPFVKGMLHQVDFKEYLKTAGTQTIRDAFGVSHRVEDVDIILTKSQVKCFGWLQQNDMTWEDYFKKFKKYNHALYITNTNKETPESFTQLNYQFLTTLSITVDEFRPKDLPHGWQHSPTEDSRDWLTKETETAYYNLTANKQYRQEYFLKSLKGKPLFSKEKKHIIASILKKNPKFIAEPVYTKQLDDQADKLLKDYSIGRLIVAGDNRFLSGDLVDFLGYLIDPYSMKGKKQIGLFLQSSPLKFPADTFYAPGATYDHRQTCTLLRNPHISRNEELQLKFYNDRRSVRKKYLSHLTDVIMVASEMLAAERLGGADYDGDMIKTISDPILNRCVKRNYFGFSDNLKNFDNEQAILMIPTVAPNLGNANDWEDCFEVIKTTLSSRIGRICNAALDRSILAYSEDADEETQKKYAEEIETLAILIGLEIDSAKSGIKPNLDQYLSKSTIKRTAFLQYKNLIENPQKKQAWYESVKNSKLEQFFDRNSEQENTATIERLPYLAKLLKENTPHISHIHYPDRELFKFAKEDHWKEKLDPTILQQVGALSKDYEACLSRIRSCSIPIKEKARKSDIERILFSRGQEVDCDQLYACFEQLGRERIATLCKLIREQNWHLMTRTEREQFLIIYLQRLSDWHDLLADFRCGGYRVLGDILCDIDDENNIKDRKQYFRQTDRPAFTQMMRAFIKDDRLSVYRETVSAKCRELLNQIIKPQLAVRYLVAIGKRNLLFDLLVDAIEQQVLEVRHDK